LFVWVFWMFDRAMRGQTSIRLRARGTNGEARKVAQKAGLDRAILASGWGLFAKRLEDKAPYRVERVNSAFSSQRCVACGHTASGNRESQAVFCCQACGYTANADFNAADIIAGGHPVTARGGMVLSGLPMNREPQLSASLVGVG
jgi:putative transposase